MPRIFLRYIPIFIIGLVEITFPGLNCNGCHGFVSSAAFFSVIHKLHQQYFDMKQLKMCYTSRLNAKLISGGVFVVTIHCGREMNANS